MRDSSAIYDLGDVDVAADETRRATIPARPVRSFRAGQTVTSRSRAPQRGIDGPGLLSLFLPGLGQLACRQAAVGLFFLSWVGLVATVGWALITALDSTTLTLRLLGYPGAIVVWTLGALYVAGALLHAAGVLTAGPAAAHSAAHPIVAGVASAILPGAGQVLAGSRARAVLFVASLWAIVALWLLDSPAVLARLDELGVTVPEFVQVATQPAVRWTAPAVIWALAVYDAVSSAATSRRA